MPYGVCEHKQPRPHNFIPPQLQHITCGEVTAQLKRCELTESLLCSGIISIIRDGVRFVVLVQLQIPIWPNEGRGVVIPREGGHKSFLTICCGARNCVGEAKTTSEGGQLHLSLGVQAALFKLPNTQLLFVKMKGESWGLGDGVVEEVVDVLLGFVVASLCGSFCC